MEPSCSAYNSDSPSPAVATDEEAMKRVAPVRRRRGSRQTPDGRPSIMRGKFALFIIALSVISALPSILSQSTPNVAECAGKESPVYLLQHNSTNGQRLRSTAVANFLDCSELCSSANDCIGVEYADGLCHVIGASQKRYVSAASAAPLATKNCVKSERVCASPFHFDIHEQKILVGFAREVVPADTIQVCLSACLNAFDTFGFECESVMYYPVDAECILNTEDRLDRPDLFVDEHEDTVIYMDNNCAGSQCYAPYVTQYVAVEGKQLGEELDHSFTDVDQASCEELCTQRLTTSVNDFNCKSFMYNNETRTCILSDERSRPLGRGQLVDAAGFTYYEKKCFASPRTCRNVPSFTRVPQMLLVGFAAFVMENVPSVTMCLDQCTNPPPETGDKFVCKSAMYYYNEQECILNAESRNTKPDLFIAEETDFVVDYFDINCRLETEQCANGKRPQTVKTLNAALPEGDGSLHVIESVSQSLTACTAQCFASAPEKCRSFNFDKTTGICNLMYLDGKTTLRPQVKSGVDFYDVHCLQGQDLSVQCLNKNGTSFSRYLYTKQPGTPSKQFTVVALSKCLDMCSTSLRCEGVNYNRRNGDCALFEQVHGVGEKDDHVDFYANLCLVNEVDTGVSSAINVPKEQQFVSVAAASSKTDAKGAASIDKSEGGSRSSLLTSGAEKKPKLREPDARRKPTTDVGVEGAQVGTGASATLSIANNGAAPATPVLIPADAVHTICNYEGIKVQIKSKESFTGVVFVKNKYDSCRVEVGNSDSATLVLGLPSNFGMKPILLDGSGSSSAGGAASEKPDATPAAATASPSSDAGLQKNEVRRRRQADRDCGIVDMDSGTYKSTVVVQTNNLGIPGLVTSMDQIYEISCNYSSMLGGKVTAAAKMTVHGPQPSLIQPRGKIELGNPVLMQMNAAGNAGHPVIQAKLGDILELRWEIMAMDEELDFFVKDCHAEPGSQPHSSSTSAERLQLIEAGCPTPAVAQKLIPNPIQVQSSAVKIAHLQAFRFDSSASIRVTCSLEICKGNCKPTSCNLPAGGQQDSWGRKKRDVDNSVTEFETKRYKIPRYAQATTSIVIIDPLQQISEPQQNAAVSMAKQSAQDFAAIGPKYYQEFGLTDDESAERHSSVEVSASDGRRASASGPSEMCMNKWTLAGVLGTLFALIVIQALIVTKYIFKRIFAVSADGALPKSMKSGTGSGLDAKSFHY